MVTVPNFGTHKMEVIHWHCDCLGLGPSVYFLHIIGLALGVGFVIGLGQCKYTIRVRIIELKENY